MKILGLIGGLSWESTATYYQQINIGIRESLGGLHSAKLLLCSLDMHEIAADQAAGDWDAATKKMIDAARSLKSGGAEAIVICTNTMHKMADEIENATGLPIIHIADATARSIKKSNLSKVALLATKYTMEEDFYKGRLIDSHGLDVIVPNESDRQIIHEIIYEELCLGKIKNSSREKYKSIIHSLVESGAQGVILGCTEIGLLIKQEDVDIPVFDTTIIHSQEAVEFSLS